MKKNPLFLIAILLLTICSCNKEKELVEPFESPVIKAGPVADIPSYLNIDEVVTGIYGSAMPGFPVRELTRTSFDNGFTLYLPETVHESQLREYVRSNGDITVSDPGARISNPLAFYAYMNGQLIGSLTHVSRTTSDVGYYINYIYSDRDFTARGETGTVFVETPRLVIDLKIKKGWNRVVSYSLDGTMYETSTMPKGAGWIFHEIVID